MQHLAVRGIIELESNRSPSIRKLDLAESMEVLDVAEAMTALAARSAADRYTGQLHEALFADVLKRLDLGAAGRAEGVFDAAVRPLYRGLLQLGATPRHARPFPSPNPQGARRER